MAIKTPFTPVNINLQAALNDLTVIYADPFSGDLTLFPARNYLNFHSPTQLVELVSSLNENSDTGAVPPPPLAAVPPDTSVPAVSAAPAAEAGKYPIATNGTGGYYPGLVIDMRKYYPGECALEITSVSSKFNTLSLGVLIAPGAQKLIYVPNFFSPTWVDNQLTTDTFSYTIANNNTGESVTGTVNISRFQNYPGIEDVYVELNPLYSGIIEINLLRFNPLLAGSRITGFGVYNTELIDAISVAPEDANKIIVNIARECSCWNCDSTDFEVFIQIWNEMLQVHIPFKLYVNLVKPCNEFIANMVEIDILGAVPQYLGIDISVYNSHSPVRLLQVDTPSDQKGSVTFNNDKASLIRYQFNRDSGYWSAQHAYDIFMYNIQNISSGEISKSYVIINKTGISVSSTAGGLTPSQTYKILPATALYKVAQSSQDKGVVRGLADAFVGEPALRALSPVDPLQPDAAQYSVFYEGSIVTIDNENNEITLSARIAINPDNGAFVGNISEVKVSGRLKYRNQTLQSDPGGAPLYGVAGQFILVA